MKETSDLNCWLVSAFSYPRAMALLVALLMFFPFAIHAAELQRLRVVETLDHQRLKLSDDSIWNLRMIWMPDFNKVTAKLLNQTVQIEPLITNRYGELIGNLYDDQGLWIQETWIAEGLAVAWPIFIDSNQQQLDENFEFMFEAEQIARDDQLGIWSFDHPLNDFFTTTDDLEVDPYALRGQFVVVEGYITEAVARQQDDQTVIFINFGEDYKQDFTIRVGPPIYSEFRKKLDGSGLSLKKLSGQNIRARGILGLYNGASLELTHPMSVEFLDE